MEIDKDERLHDKFCIWLQLQFQFGVQFPLFCTYGSCTWTFL